MTTVLRQKYVELQTTTNFSFLRGASHADKLFERADELGFNSLGITDRNSLAGIARAHTVAKNNDMRLIVGCRLDLQDGPSLLAYPTSLSSYNNLSELLTLGNRRTEKGDCLLYKADVYASARGLLLAAVPPLTSDRSFEQAFAEYYENFGRQLSLAATHYYNGIDAKRLAKLAELSSRFYVPLLATNDVHYYSRDQYELQATLTAVRELCSVADAGYKLFSNGERCLKPAAEMQRLFKVYPLAIKQTQVIAEACQFSLSELKYEYPEEITSEGRTPQQELEYHTWKGVAKIYGDRVPEKITEQINKELRFINQANYAKFFLTVYDVVREARERGILCSGRGSAANSAVCYYLGITVVDPEHFELLFERFMSTARNEPPDIDVDFEHERREEIIQYVYQKYGRERAAMVATNVVYHQKSAVQDVGKALSLTTDTTKRLSDAIYPGSSEWFDAKRVRDNGLNPADPHLQKVLILSGQLIQQNAPRHLSQHSGGMVIAGGRLSALCPILNASMENRTQIEWDKYDCEALEFMKVDLLALGILTMERKCLELLEQHYGLKYTLETIPQECSETYDMICAADTMGVFQIESRAQMASLPRTKPRTFYDLVVQCALVRPGPIQGGMVHPYIRRRNGEEPITFPSPELKKILGRTKGVILFQEQAMAVAIVAAGYSPEEADQLRRAMSTFKFTKGVNKHEEKLVSGMMARGYSEFYARNVFQQLQGFGSYGFPESHAASFAKHIYVSCWMKCHYPDAFACAILNSQPMGFYKPSQLIQDAQQHKVQVRSADVNHSDWDYTLEQQAGWYRALRIGFRQIKGLPMLDAVQISECRGDGYRSITDLWRRTGLPRATLEKLAAADCFQSLKLDRRQALLEIAGLGSKPLPLFAYCEDEGIEEADITLDEMTGGERVVNDYSVLRLSLNGHPLEFIRQRLANLGVITIEQLKNMKQRSRVKVGGLVLVRQRPGTAKGVCFVTIEDETGAGNGVVFKKCFEEHRPAMLTARLMVLDGWVQRSKEGIVHLIANKVHDYSFMLGDIASAQPTPVEAELSRADAIKYGPRGSAIAKQFPDARNYH